MWNDCGKAGAALARALEHINTSTSCGPDEDLAVVESFVGIPMRHRARCEVCADSWDAHESFSTCHSQSLADL